jgi:hypothetical protein
MQRSVGRIDNFYCMVVTNYLISEMKGALNGFWTFLKMSNLEIFQLFYTTLFLLGTFG